MIMLCPVCDSLQIENAQVCETCGAALGETPLFPHALATGTLLHQEQYRLDAVLGQGGFGITYRGLDLQLQREVAIKEFFPLGCTRGEKFPRSPAVLPNSAAPEFAAARDKFIAEARLLARFDHPSIVPVYTVFEANNSAYMVMELVRGQTLFQLLEVRGTLPESEAVNYCVVLGEALQHIHEKGLLHLDLKPENVIVASNGQPVLVDFGSARDFATRQTRRQSVLVTPGYAPLEQYARSARHGAYSDVYALAATLFHLLTGQMPPPATDRAVGATLPDVRALNRKISAPVALAIHDALQMEIARRPQSAAAFVSRLRPDERTRAVAIAHGLSASTLNDVPQVFHVLRGHTRAVTAVAFSPDGMMAATGSNDHMVRLWNVHSGELRCTFHELNARVTAVAFSVDGSLLAAAAQSGHIFLWEPHTGQFKSSMSWTGFQVVIGREDAITALDFSPAQLLLASGSRGVYSHKGHVTLWDPQQSRQTRTLNGRYSWVNCVAFSPDGTRLVAGDLQGCFYLWDVTSSRLLHTSPPQGGPMRDIKFSPDGQKIAAACARAPVSFWNLESYEKCGELEEAGADAQALDWSSDGALIVTASGAHDETVRVWSAASHTLRHTLSAHRSGVSCVALSGDGQRIISGSEDHSAIIWNLNRV